MNEVMGPLIRMSWIIFSQWIHILKVQVGSVDTRD